MFAQCICLPALLVAVGLTTVVSSAGITETPRDVTKLKFDGEKVFDIDNKYFWSEFTNTYKKSYMDPEENARRMAIYHERAMKSHVSKLAYVHGALEHFLVINPNSDLNGDELAKIHDVPLYAMERDYNYNVSLPQKNNTDEVFVDHRESGCIIVPQPVKYCVTDYLLAPMAYYEWLYCKQTGQAVKFSEQYVMDCTANLDTRETCGDGEVDTVTKFAEQNGFELAKNHRNLYETTTCPTDMFKAVGLSEKKVGQIRLDKPALMEITNDQFESYIKTTPILAVLLVDPDFYTYKGGVHRGTDCWLNDDAKLGSLVVLIVGSGREDGQDYWLVKYNLGRNFDDNGFIKIAKDTPCFDEEGKGYVLKAFSDPSGSYQFSENPDYEPGLIRDLVKAQDFMKLVN